MAGAPSKRGGGTYLVLIVLVLLAGLFYAAAKDVHVPPGTGIGGYIKAVSEKISRMLAGGLG